MTSGARGGKGFAAAAFGFDFEEAAEALDVCSGYARKMFDPLNLPPDLRAQLLAGRVVPFLGAGIGLPCGLPDWRGLLESLLQWAIAEDIVLPNADQIGRAIEGGELDVPAHALGQAFGDRLDEALSTILTGPGVAPTALHQLLGSVAWPIVLTTNFDNLLPDSFAHRLEPITWQDSERLGDALRSGQRHLMLAHGWIGRPGSIVLTPAQYRESFHSPAQQMYLKTLLSHYTLLFIGCSLRDPDIKYFLEESKKAFELGPSPHYAILPRTEIDDIRRTHFRENFGIHILTYEPSSGHPEIQDFVHKVVDVLPPPLLFDPSVKSQSLDAAKSAFSKLAPDEYLLKFAATAREVAGSGFARTAWTSLKSEIERTGDATPETRLMATVELVDLMRRDHEYDFAVRVLQDAAQLREDPTIPQAVLAVYAREAFTTYLDAYCLAEAAVLWEEGKRFGLSESDLEDTARMLAQARFLNSGEAPSCLPVTSLEVTFACESLAQAGDLDSAVEKLQTTGQEEITRGNYLEALKVENTRAHVLYLSCRLDEAWHVFEDQIAPYKASIPLDKWAELQGNQTFVGFPLRKPVDMKALTASRDVRGQESDRAARSEDLLLAESASREQRHYDSLPRLWRELRRSYSGLNWSARVRAHSRLAWETYAAGWIRETTHHAIMGNNVPCLERLADLLIGRRDVSLISASVEYLSTNCQLPHHANLAAKFISRLADVLPQARMPDIIALLARTALIESVHSDAEQCITAAWNAIARLAFRLDENQSATLLQAAQDSSVLKEYRFSRKSVLVAIRALAGRVTEYDWEALTSNLIGIALDPSDYDYESTLLALEVIARKSEAAKAQIRRQLYKSGPIDAVRAIYAVTFSAELDRDRLATVVSKVAEFLGEQVTTNTQPEFRLSRFATVQVTTPHGDSLHVQLCGGQAELRYIVVHRDALGDEQVQQIVEAALRLIVHPSNIRHNRLMLMDFLYDIRSRLTLDQALAIFKAAHPLVTGSAPASPTDLPSSRTTDRFRFNSPSQADEQANALRLVIGLCDAFGSDAEVDLPSLALKALLHTALEVRQSACAALTDLKECPPDLETALVASALDPEWRVAAAALHSATTLLGRGQLRSKIPLLTIIAAKNLGADRPIVRALTARLVHDLVRSSLPPQNRQLLEEMLETLSKDVSYQVRQAARYGNATDVGDTVGDVD